MALLDEFFAGLLSSFGPAGLLLAVFLIFYLDSMVIPLLPELFAILIFQAGGATLGWGLLILGLALLAEVLGNSTVYAIVRRTGLPLRVRRLMEEWTNVLLAKREMLILTNRVAPAVPFVGFFIAALGWSYPKSMAYIALGGFAKYSFLLLVVGLLNVTYDPGLARRLTLTFALAFIAVSVFVGWRRKGRLKADQVPQRGAP